MGQSILQARVVERDKITAHSTPVDLALFNPDGTPYVPTQASDLTDFLEAEPAAFQADTTAADLAALKVDFNLLLDKLQTAGLMASS